MDLAGLRKQVDEDERMANGVLFACRDSRQPWPPEQEPGRGGPALTEYLRHFSEQRALREVAAKRKILDEHVPGAYLAWDDDKLACRACGDTVTVEWPCTTISAVAAIYSDDPLTT